MEICHDYDDILDLPHHVSDTHPQMPMLDRAAQFSPFAALTGYGAVIEETARLTERKRELPDEEKQKINRELNALKEQMGTNPIVKVVFFEKDLLKEGGRYRTITGSVKKLDEHGHTLELDDGKKIAFDDILSLE